MKLRNIFTMLAAVFALTFVGCQKQEQFLEEVKVSKSYIALPVEGGDVKIQVEASANWTITATVTENTEEIIIAYFRVDTALCGFPAPIFCAPIADTADSIDEGTKNTKPIIFSTMPTAAASVRPLRLAIAVISIKDI